MANGLRIVAGLVSTVMILTVIRLVSEGQTAPRILAEVLLIGTSVYLLTHVLRPSRFGRADERVDIEPIEPPSGH